MKQYIYYICIIIFYNILLETMQPENKNISHVFMTAGFLTFNTFYMLYSRFLQSLLFDIYIKHSMDISGFLLMISLFIIVGISFYLGII